MAVHFTYSTVIGLFMTIISNPIDSQYKYPLQIPHKLAKLDLEIETKTLEKRVMNLQKLKQPLNVRNDVRDSLGALFDKYLTKDMVVFDIGCGTKPFEPVVSPKVKEYVGVDIEDGFYDAGHIDLVGTAYDVPAEGKSVDAIISSQVTEHLENPWDAFKEANRLLKDDGLYFISSPFMYPIHADPYDYGRYTIFQLEKKLNENGFDIVETSEIGGFWYCVAMFLGVYLQMFDRGILNKLKIMKAISWVLKITLYFIHGLEGFVLNTMDNEEIRKKWVINYTIIARKRHTA